MEEPKSPFLDKRICLTDGITRGSHRGHDFIGQLRAADPAERAGQQ